jgi:hypothetical protein
MLFIKRTMRGIITDKMPCAYRELVFIRSEIIYNGTAEDIVAGSYMAFLSYQTRTLRADLGI